MNVHINMINPRLGVTRQDADDVECGGDDRVCEEDIRMCVGRYQGV